MISNSNLNTFGLHYNLCVYDCSYFSQKKKKKKTNLLLKLKYHPKENKNKNERQREKVKGWNAGSMASFC